MGTLTCLLAGAAVLGYALDLTLMKKLYESLRPLTVTAYRGLALGITMLVVLPFVDWTELNLSGRHLLLLLAAAFTGVIANVTTAHIMKSFSVGVASSLRNGSRITLGVLIGYILWQEKISVMEACLIGFIVLGALKLGLDKTQPQRCSEGRVSGLLYTAVFGLSMAVSSVCVAALARELPPLAVAYAWEVSIGLAAFSGCLWGPLVKEQLTTISREHFVKFVCYSFPSVVATGCFACALREGRVGMVLAALGAMPIACAVFSWFHNKERLTWPQWGVVLIVVGCVVCFRLCGS